MSIIWFGFHVDRWTRPDIAPESGMANVIVGIPTGYVISRDTVEWMYRANYTGLHRILFYNQKLVTFFSHVSAHTAHATLGGSAVSLVYLQHLYRSGLLKAMANNDDDDDVDIGNGVLIEGQEKVDKIRPSAS